jgi:hypothetical protein
MLKKYISLLISLLLIVGCVAAAPLQQANGSWQLSSEDITALNEQFKNMMESLPQNGFSLTKVTLTLEAATNEITIGGSYMVNGEYKTDELIQTIEFNVISENPESNELILDVEGRTYTLTIKGDRLELKGDRLEVTAANGESMVFGRIK